MSSSLVRAWSGGTIEELRTVSIGNYNSWCNGYLNCQSQWVVISSPAAGLHASAGINFDHQVDGDDLATVLGAWGDAPRAPFPPSDCPLNLINP